MINSIEHATVVQERRYRSGRFGHAKAVKRYFARRGDPEGYKRLSARYFSMKREQ